MSLFSTYVSSTCFGPHRSIIRSVLYKLYSQALVCAVIQSRFIWVTGQVLWRRCIMKLWCRSVVYGCVLLLNWLKYIIVKTAESINQSIHKEKWDVQNESLTRYINFQFKDARQQVQESILPLNCCSFKDFHSRSYVFPAKVSMLLSRAICRLPYETWIKHRL